MDIGFILMDNILKIKYIALFLYLLISLLFFSDDFFLENSKFISQPHLYNNFAFMVAIFSLGIIFSAMIYNFAFYFYIRNRQYLYYALAQFFVLLSLLSLEALQIYPFTQMYNFKSFYLLDISQTLMLVFSLLFVQEFFQTYKTNKLNNVIKTVLYLSIFDLLLSLILGHTFLTKFIPTVIWIAFVLSEAFRYIKPKDVPFYFLMIGWHIVIVTLILELSYIIDPNTFDFPFLHIAFAMESILLSFALSYKFKLIENEQQRQQSLLLQQSRLASMGEMISIIAHQWRQPLTFLSYSLMYIKSFHHDNQEVKQSIQEANEQIEYMSKNIETFRSFYNPAKEKENFSIEMACTNVLDILRYSLKVNKIEINFQSKKDFSLLYNKNEFEQVILNIINNAKDALVQQKTINPQIKIIIDKNKITIRDNAGGISKSEQIKIFEPYFSTKENHDGIGLYIAKTIIEKEMKGKLLVKSTKVFSEFTIEF